MSQDYYSKENEYCCPYCLAPIDLPGDKSSTLRCNNCGETSSVPTGLDHMGEFDNYNIHISDVKYKLPRWSDEPSMLYLKRAPLSRIDLLDNRRLLNSGSFLTKTGNFVEEPISWASITIGIIAVILIIVIFFVVLYWL